MASDLDSVEKIFCGTWKYDRDENFVECMRKLKFQEAEVEFIAKAKPKLLVERRGDFMFMDLEVTPGVSHDITFKLGEEFVSKDKTDPPAFHLKEIATFKNGALTFKAWSQLEGASKIDYQTTMTRNGEELHTLISPIDDMSISGDRIYKLV